MKYFSLTICMCCLLFFISCRKENKSVGAEKTTSTSLSQKDWGKPSSQLVINLESGDNLYYVDGPVSSNIRPHPFLLKSGIHLYEFDLSNGSYEKIKSFSEEGPEGVGLQNVADFLVQYGENRFIFSPSGERKLVNVADGSSSVIYEIAPGTEWAITYQGKPKPIIDENLVIFPKKNYPYIKNKKTGLLVYHIDENKFTEETSWPEIYLEKDFGSWVPYTNMPSVGTSENSVFLSYPVLDKILEFDKSFTLVNEIELSSPKVGEIVALSKVAGSQPGYNKEVHDQYYRSMNCYIHYVFDRDTKSHVRSYQINASKPNRYGYLILPVGQTQAFEFEISPDHDYYRSFVHGGKIYLFNEKRFYEQESEKQLFYDVYDIKELVQS